MKKCMKEKKFFLIIEYQLTNVKGVMEIKNHHLATFREVADSGRKAAGKNKKSCPTVC